MTDSPPPPGWYADPRDQRNQRYWTGQTWTDRVLPLTVLTPVADLDHPLPGRPRPRWARVSLTVVAAVLAIAAVLAVTDMATSWFGFDWRMAGVLVLWPVLMWLLPLVSYRRRDVLLTLIAPPFAIWLFGRVAWRLAYLPFRDWAPREDEAAGWLQVRHPTEPGALLYVKAGGLRQQPLDTTGRNAG